MTLKAGFVCVAIAASYLTTGSARACLNDREIIIAENEFRSSYLRAPQEPGVLERVPVGGLITTVAGVALVACTAFVARRPRSANAPAAETHAHA